MLKRHWTSENLVFSEFSNDEAHLAKSIFDSNSNVKVLDPTFREWPLAEYEKLINESCRSKLPDDQEAFYLRKSVLRKMRWLVMCSWNFMLLLTVLFGSQC